MNREDYDVVADCVRALTFHETIPEPIQDYTRIRVAQQLAQCFEALDNNFDAIGFIYRVTR